MPENGLKIKSKKNQGFTLGETLIKFYITLFHLKKIHWMILFITDISHPMIEIDRTIYLNSALN